MVTIYIITNTIDGKVYIGQTRRSLSRRWIDHKSAGKSNSPCPIAQAIRTHGPDAFTITALDNSDSGQQGDELERLYIALYGSMDPERGYNRVSGGLRDYSASAEVKAKMAAAQKASPATAAQIERMCVGNRGRKATAEHRNKIASALRGKIKSADWRRKISETKKSQGRKWTPEMREQILESRKRTYELRNGGPSFRKA